MLIWLIFRNSKSCNREHISYIHIPRIIQTSCDIVSFPFTFIMSSTRFIYPFSWSSLLSTLTTIKKVVGFPKNQSKAERTDWSTITNTRLFSTSHVLPSCIRNRVSFNRLQEWAQTIAKNPSLFVTLPNNLRKGLLIALVFPQVFECPVVNLNYHWMQECVSYPLLSVPCGSKKTVA